MRPKDLATWMSLLIVVVALGRPARSMRPAQPPQQPPSVDQAVPPAEPIPSNLDLWSPANPTDGGIVFLVNPADAAIYVDGGYAGRPLHFSPQRPLLVGAGQHRVELIATGYETARVDIAVLPGYVETCDIVMTKR